MDESVEKNEKKCSFVPLDVLSHYFAIMFTVFWVAITLKLLKISK